MWIYGKEGKLGKYVDLWGDKHEKGIVDSTVIRLKAKEVYSYIIQDKENIKPFLASAGWFTFLKVILCEKW